MSELPLVSIITPCYNGENYVHRFLNSILIQTYSNIELIFVNDGSTDKTEDIVLSYKNKFELNEIKLIYVYQNNKGQAEAINNGLSTISGKYICWPDSDDYLEKESILKRVKILEQYSEFAIVTSGAFIRNIDDLKNPLKIVTDYNSKKYLDNQFELLLLGESLICSGCHMMRTISFKDTHPGNKIFPSRGGQNWQILLPVYYKFKRYILNEPLYNIVIRNNSHSRGDNTEEKKLYRSNEHKEILINTISSMAMDSKEKEKYIVLIKERYARKNLRIAHEYKNQDLFKTQYDFLRIENKLKFRDKILFLTLKNKWIDNIMDIAIFFKRKSKI